MGQSNSQEKMVKHILTKNKTLNITNTDNCITIDENGELVIDNCTDASNFTFKNGKLINDSDNRCINSKLHTGACDLDSNIWSYDPSTGYVKDINSGKCLVHNNKVLTVDKEGVPCISFNYGPLNTYTEKDRLGKCGNCNIVPHKLNYSQDNGKCDTNRVCSPLGVCKDYDYRTLDYDSKYQYLYKNGKYDGLKTFTESDRNSRCGPLYLLQHTKGYLPDDGSCNAGRYCSAFGECSNFPEKQSFMKGIYDGPEVLIIKNTEKIVPPESNYNIVYSDSFPAYFGNKGIYTKF